VGEEAADAAGSCGIPGRRQQQAQQHVYPFSSLLKMER